MMLVVLIMTRTEVVTNVAVVGEWGSTFKSITLNISGLIPGVYVGGVA